MTDQPEHIASRGAGRGYRMIALDLDSEQQAVELARKIAERSGRAVTVSDADGEVLGVFESATRN